MQRTLLPVDNLTGVDVQGDLTADGLPSCVALCDH